VQKKNQETEGTQERDEEEKRKEKIKKSSTIGTLHACYSIALFKQAFELGGK